MPILRNEFTRKFKVPITPTLARKLSQWCSTYELRDNHQQAYMSAMLGVEIPHFYHSDQEMLFTLCGVDQTEFAQSVKHVEKVLAKYANLVKAPYNLFTVWIAHLAQISKVSAADRRMIQFSLFKLLNYKFFTSVVINDFPHGANEDVMQATIDNLSGKYDIKKAGTDTWALVINQRSGDIIDRQSIHRPTFDTFTPDAKVAYVLTDVQSRIRTKLRLIISEYYKNHEKNIKLGSRTMVDTIDGDKVIKNMTSVFDVMIDSVCNQALNLSRFINHDHIRLVCKLTTNVRPDMMRALLAKFSDIAVAQQQSGRQNQITPTRGKHPRYTGYRILLNELIQKTYRSLILAGDVDLKSKLEILEGARNLYRSSRIADSDILTIKESVEDFVKLYGGTSREATIASLKVAFILYVILLTFDYL